jgi:hypothetical protein
MGVEDEVFPLGVRASSALILLSSMVIPCRLKQVWFDSSLALSPSRLLRRTGGGNSSARSWLQSCPLHENLRLTDHCNDFMISDARLYRIKDKKLKRGSF